MLNPGLIGTLFLSVLGEKLGSMLAPPVGLVWLQRSTKAASFGYDTGWTRRDRVSVHIWTLSHLGEMAIWESQAADRSGKSMQNRGEGLDEAARDNLT